MHERLLGYLFDCIDPDERREIEAALATDDSLRTHLEILRRCAHPLEIDRASLPPPKDLAANTCHKLRGLLGRDGRENPPPGPPA